MCQGSPAVAGEMGTNLLSRVFRLSPSAKKADLLLEDRIDMGEDIQLRGSQGTLRDLFNRGDPHHEGDHKDDTYVIGHASFVSGREG